MVQHFINSELFKSLLALILVMNQKVKYKLVLLEYDCIDKTVNIFKLILFFLLKGDGLEFKRHFLKVRNQMKKICSKIPPLFPMPSQSSQAQQSQPTV